MLNRFVLPFSVSRSISANLVLVVPLSFTPERLKMKLSTELTDARIVPDGSPAADAVTNPRVILAFSLGLFVSLQGRRLPDGRGRNHKTENSERKQEKPRPAK
jgi:hypothetical protein